MTRAVIYARFSSENQREDSIEIQTRECKNLIDREQWTLTQVYADYAMTGTNDERPGFQNCLADGLKDKYDVLVIYKGDRLARNVSIAQDFKNQLFRAGKRIVSVREGELTDSPDGFLIGGIGDLFAEYYSRNLSVLVKGGLEQNARNCKASGQRYYGYDVDKEDHFIIKEHDADVVRWIFNSYITGASCKDIAEMLNNKGIKTQRKNKWTVATVSSVIHQKRYTGEYNFAGMTVQDGMPRIIDDSVYEEAQKINKTRKVSRRSTEDYLLTDKLFCLDCGGSVNGRSGYGKAGKKYTYYGCNTKNKCCSVPSQLIEDIVIETTYGIIKQPEYVKMLTDATLSALKQVEARTVDVQAEIEKIQQKKQNLINAIAEGVDVDSIKPALRNCDERLTQLLNEAPAQKSRVPINEEKVRAFIEATLNKGSDDRETCRTIIRQFVDKIYINNSQIMIHFYFGIDDFELQFAPDPDNPKQKHPDNARLSGCSYKSKWLPIPNQMRTQVYLYETGFILSINHNYKKSIQRR